MRRYTAVSLSCDWSRASLVAFAADTELKGVVVTAGGLLTFVKVSAVA